MDGRTTREMMVDLTDDEREVYSKMLARITTYQQELEGEKKATTSAFKEKIDRCISDCRIFARKVSTGQELRVVECRWKAREDMMFLYRDDTEELIDRRKMTVEEKQGTLFEPPEEAIPGEEGMTDKKSVG